MYPLWTYFSYVLRDAKKLSLARENAHRFVRTKRVATSGEFVTERKPALAAIPLFVRERERDLNRAETHAHRYIYIYGARFEPKFSGGTTSGDHHVIPVSSTQQSELCSFALFFDERKKRRSFEER